MIQRKGKDERTEGPAAHMMQSRGPKTRVLGNATCTGGDMYGQEIINVEGARR